MQNLLKASFANMPRIVFVHDGSGLVHGAAGGLVSRTSPDTETDTAVAELSLVTAESAVEFTRITQA